MPNTTNTNANTGANPNPNPNPGMNKACARCGCDVGPSRYYLWHMDYEGCRDIKEPIHGLIYWMEAVVAQREREAKAREWMGFPAAVKFPVKQSPRQSPRQSLLEAERHVLKAKARLRWAQVLGWLMVGSAGVVLALAWWYYLVDFLAGLIRLTQTN